MTRNIMPIMVGALSFLCSLNSIAASISSLKIDDEQVVFSLNQTSAENMPACVTTGNETYFGFSLNSANGKHLYRALIFANSAGKDVTVKGAGDCADVAGIQRPLSISTAF
ncbi:MAG: hypothetical protein MK214_15660 [Thalassotalea sp.]|nr:hypothetical protein [Thalassotalea sp.]